MKQKPWKPHPRARTCKGCGSYAPGQIPAFWNGERGYWHLHCLIKAKKVAKELAQRDEIASRSVSGCKPWPDWRNVS